MIDLKFCSICGRPYDDNRPELHTHSKPKAAT